MNITGLSKDRYTEYCREHLNEFRNEVREDASRAINGWPCRIVAVLLALSSVITFVHPSNQDNPLLIYTLFTYAAPILIIVLYPIAIFFVSTLKKYSPITLDLIVFSSMCGFLLTLVYVLAGAGTISETQTVYLALSGQINFVLLLSTAFSYHTNYYVTLSRNVFLTIALAIGLYVIDVEFFLINWIQVLQGFLAGSIFSWIFFVTIRTRFYLKSTDADVRQHLYNQLSKLVYPHQLERIKLGDELENTMPLKEGKAICNVFDVQKSGEIRHERTQEFFMGVFQAFLEICMKGYAHNPLRSRAFRLKETGDGFISSIGYPFLPIESQSLADTAVSAAVDMFDAFNKEVEKFGYSRPIKGAMGLAYNSVQGTFQSGGIRSYDLFGDALIQAAKYEELRKQPMVWDLITSHAAKLGLKDFHIMIVQEVIYNSLSPQYRELFVEVDLSSKSFTENNFQLLYDNDARYLYFHLRE